MDRRRVGGRLGRQFPAAPPHNEDDADVAEGHEHCWNHEYVGGQEREVKLALPPSSVAATGTLVLDHALRVDADGHLHGDWFYVNNTSFNQSIHHGLVPDKSIEPRRPSTKFN